jgi:hypothetical protein
MQKKAVPITKSTPKPKPQPQPGRNRLGQWTKGTCGCPPEKQVIVPGHQWRFPPGVSGNPHGIPKARHEFEQAFYAALIGQGNPEEAARLLCECARAKEAWAVQLLLQRLAPQDSKVRLEVSKADGDDEGFNPGNLDPEQLDQLIRLMEIAAGEPPALEISPVREESQGIH